MGAFDGTAMYKEQMQTTLSTEWWIKRHQVADDESATGSHVNRLQRGHDGCAAHDTGSNGVEEGGGDQGR